MNREELHKQIRTMLGEGMIDIEPDPSHIDTAIDIAFDRYRQRTESSRDEAYVFLEVQKDKNEYILPNEIVDVRDVLRRGTSGMNAAGGTQIDPFNLAFTNLYLLQAGGTGGLATYHAWADYQETVGRMFGLYVNYRYNQSTKKLTLVRAPNSNETVLLWVYKLKTEEEILENTYAKPWIRSYALAQTKLMMAEARSFFSAIPGPGGGTTLNGSEMKADAQTTIDQLEQELNDYVDGSMVYGFIMG